MCDQHGINERQAAVERREIIDNLPVDTTKLEWPLVGCSVVHEEMIMIAAKYAQVPETVYLYGEAGVGKQTLARLMHTLTNDKTAFCHIDCAKTPTPILRAFIFNAYQQPETGSLYLSSVDQMPLSLQKEVAGLMVRSLREGGPRFFLSSRTLSLQEMDENKLYPSFLLHLLQYPLELPPLHKRAQDIPVLLEFYAQKNGATLKLSDAKLQELQSRQWPENIRELIARISEG